MSHGPKKQSTGSNKQHRDRHQVSNPKGPGKGPGPTKTSYTPSKYQPGAKPKR